MNSKRFTILTVLFCTCLIASNLFETKIFNAGPITLTGGFLVFPIAYILNDCLTEVYGTKKARFVIFLAVLMNLFVVTMAQLVRILPPETYWTGQEHFDYIFEADLRITIASMAAFLTGSLSNSQVMAKMKLRDGEKRFGWRAIASTLVGESLDSLVFFPIAFWPEGWKNIIILMVTQVILKTVYEILVLPFSSIFVRKLKEAEAQAE